MGTGLGSLEYSNFSHDAQNRLTGWTYSKTTGETGSATYTYDDSGARVTRTATKTGLAPESVTTIDPEYEVDHNRQRTRAHLFVAGARVATLERQAPAPASGSASPVLRELHYHADRLGTPRLITDATGAVVQRTFPKPFGELWKVVDGAGNDIAPSSRASQHLFTGQHADVESDLHYFGARYYDPLVGQFFEVDPLFFESDTTGPANRSDSAFGAMRLYSYANGNPLRYVDPDGRDSIPVVFPDYLVSTPVGKIPWLAHAGDILIDPQTGSTRYYDYGRYDTKELGLVRREFVPDVVMGENGLPTRASLSRLLRSVSEQAGAGGRVEGVYVRNGNFREMERYAEERRMQNSDPQRQPYRSATNNCMHFCVDTLRSGGAEVPVMLDPRPYSYIGELQEFYENRISFDPIVGTLAIDGRIDQ